MRGDIYRQQHKHPRRDQEAQKGRQRCQPHGEAADWRQDQPGEPRREPGRGAEQERQEVGAVGTLPPHATFQIC